MSLILNRSRNAAFMIIVLLVSLAFTLNIRSVRAQTASIDGVDSPSVVRAGETFYFFAYGTYETSEAMDLVVVITERGGSLVGGPNTYSVTPAGGTTTRGGWYLTFDLEAYAPRPAEYDAEGKYYWALTALLRGFGSVDFTITIIRRESAPTLSITNAYVAPREGDEIYVGDRVVAALDYEFSLPAGSTFRILFRNSLGIRPSAFPEVEDGWFEFPRFRVGTVDEPTSSRDAIGAIVNAPLDPESNWQWDFRISAVALDGSEVSDDESRTVQVLEARDRRAQIGELLGPSAVAPAETFSVTVPGVYVFPEGDEGDLQLEIVHGDGSPIPGGETHTISHLSGRGPFSETFTFTSPDAEGEMDLMAVLRISGNPDPADEESFSIQVRAGIEELSRYLEITSVKINGGEPPQDVTYGGSFIVDVGISWNLPSDAQIVVAIWDWDRIVQVIANDRFEIGVAGPGSDTFTLEVPDYRVPPRNGPWTLRATVYWGVGWVGRGNERIFQANVVDAEGIAGGRSDWAVTGVWASPIDPFLGSDVSFTARIEVTTVNPLPQTVTVAYSLDGVEQSRDLVTYEDGMVFQSVSSPPWTPTLGDHTIIWEVDPDHDYDDPNRTNNVREVRFSVTETPQLPPETEPPTEPPPAGQEFDFYVTAVPTETTVSSPATYTVTVDVTSGNPEPVQLTLENPPAGVSYLFTPPSGTPSYTSTLTITTASNLPAGTYQLTIKGVGGGKERYKPITLKVEHGPAYSLSVSPNSAQTKPGETVTFTVTTSSDEGYGQYVNLMVSGLPSGVTYKLEPRASTPPFDSTLTLQFSQNVNPGVYTVAVSGSGADPKRTTITIRVEGARATGGSEAVIDYLAAGILGAVVAVIAGASVFAVRRVRGKKTKIFCTECGARLALGTEFCPQCGTKQVGKEKHN